MLNIPLMIFLFIIFALMIISYSVERFDFLSISIVLSFLAATVTGVVLELNLSDFVEHISFEAILVILGISIITKIAQDNNILEYIAVKLFKISRGKRRTFFYLLCILTTLMAAFITDVVVIIILGPVVVRLCRFLRIDAGTYLMGMSICVNIGSTMTPFSSGKNIIISTAFNLDTLYFIENYWIFAAILLFVTIFLMDRLFLRKEPSIEKEHKTLYMELINEDVMVENKTMFIFNSIAILLTIVLFVILPLLYLTAIFAAFILVIINKNYTKKKAPAFFKELEWDVIFFFISLYIIIGCLLEAGFKDLIRLLPFQEVSPMLIPIIVLIFVSVISGFVANNPVAVILLPIVEVLSASVGSTIPLYFAFIFGLSIGGNLIPQASSVNIMTLKIAKEAKVKNLNYKRSLKVGASFTLIHILLTLGYTLLLGFIYG
ncbi:MAG: Arsenical pump membrane protein [Promethearchaeota archaeon]|nr:MAG: Arsenical pump membrane protein [Candidatus Lokiarchaeota archaeon]